MNEENLEQEAQNDAHAFNQAVEYYAKAQGLRVLEGFHKWEQDPAFKQLIADKLPLFVAQNIFRAIISRCMGAATVAGQTADQFAEKLKADPIYQLASDGLRECTDAAQIK